MPRLARSSLAAALALLACSGTAAQASTDQWVRWNIADADDRGATIRSIDFTEVGKVSAASEDDGVFDSVNAGATFAAANGGLTGNAGAMNVRQVVNDGAGSLWAATSVGLFKRGVGGGNWTPVGQGAGPNKMNLPTQSIVFNSPTDIVVGVASASPGVYRSTNGGDTWTKASGIANSSVFHMKGAAPFIFAASDSGLYRSADGGSSFQLASDGLPFTNILRVEPGFLGKELFVGTNSGVYRSLDFGETWFEASGQPGAALPSGGIRALWKAPTGWGASRLLAGTDSGVYASKDDGKSWRELSGDAFGAETDIGGLQIQALGYNPLANPGFLFAGTQGHGIYALPLQPVTSIPKPTLSPASGLSVGDEVTATAGTPANASAPFTHTYTWFACPDQNDNNTNACTVTGTGPEHVVSDGEGNMFLRVKVHTKGLVPPDLAASAAKFSDATAKVTPAAGPDLLVGNPGPRILGPGGVNAGQQSFDWGTVLTASPGTWTAGGNPITFAYQWQRCNANGGNCIDIPNAQGPTYTTGPDDANLKIGLLTRGSTATNFKESGPVTTSTVTEQKPSLVDAPRVIGDAYVGSTLDSMAGAWKGRNMTFFRTWQVCEADGTGCNAIPSETGKQHVVNKIWKGKRLRLRVQVSNAAGSQDDREAFSDLTPVIGDAPGSQPEQPQNPPTPQNPQNPQTPQQPVLPKSLGLVFGKGLKVGSKLSAPTIAGATKLKYQWLRNGKPIKKATKRTYRVSKKDRGRKLSLRIRGVFNGKAFKLTTKSVKIPRRK